jgi:predicted permease
VVSALLLHPLPYKDAERLVILWNRSPGLEIAFDWFSTAQFFDIKNGPAGFEDVALAIGANQSLTGDGEPERIGVIRVSSNLLPLFGARARAGRLFTAEDDVPGRAGTAVLGYATWRRRYGADPGVLGRTLVLNGNPYQVIGVLPEDFSLPRDVLPTLGVAEEGEIFLPLPLAQSAATDRNHEDYNVVARLKPGVSLKQAQAGLDALTARLRREHPDVYPANGGLTFSAVPLLEQAVGNVRRTLLVLFGAVACVLLIACANVANLLLARALAREKELALRRALGAGAWRVARQLLTESLSLALLGGLVAVLLAFGAVRFLQSVQPQDVPRLRDVAVNREVLSFTLALCTASGILFGLAPLASGRRRDVFGALKDGARAPAGTPWGRGNRLRRLLVVWELAASLVLVVGAGLLVKSYARLQGVAPGFDGEGVLTFELSLTSGRYQDAAAVRNAYRELWERLDDLPGVTASGGVTSLPLSGYFAWGPITVEGRTPLPGESFLNADQRVVGGRYFEAMGIPLRRGRFFAPDDTPDQPRVVVVDERMAHELWPNQDPIGKRVRLGDAKVAAPWRTVVGVVGRVKQYGLDSDGRMALYLPQTQSGSRALYVAVKSTREPASLAAAIRQQVRALDPDLPVYRVRPMHAWLFQSLARQRFAMTLLTAFAGLALALAALGTYGVMAYLVAQGTREIGIRIALGATPRTVTALVLRGGLALGAAGVSLGLLLALALTRFVGSLLFGVAGTDPLTFLAGAVLLGASALLASYLPARRAARVDPMLSLRAD